MAIAAIAALGSVLTQAIVYGAVNWALVATTFVLSALSRALAPKAPTLASQLRDRTETVRTAVAPHKIIYGEVPLSGPLVFAASTGASNEYLHLVIALTGHECEAMTTVWFNDIAVGTLDVDGNVTDGQFSGLARIHYHLGSPAQNADTDLVAECGAQGWTTDHRLQGRGYLYVRLKYDATAYPNGIPNIKVLVKGKQVYDPRTSTTGWSRNWALCVRDYLTATYGLRCAVGDIDDAAITLAANISDEAVPLAVGTQTRYTCDGVLDLSLRPIDHIRAMLSGAAGALVYTQGQYRPFAGAYVTPVVTLTADHLRGTLTVRPRIARKSLFNAVRGTFVDPDKYWQASDFPPMANGTYAAQDGGEEIWADIELPFTIDSIRAQRLAKIHLEKSRQGITIDFPANLSAVKIAVWDVVRITLAHLGWSAKEFRVTGWKMAADGLGVDLVLQEESAASWNWSAGEATIVDPAPDTNLISAAAVPPPTSLTVFSGATHQLTGDDGINHCRLYATWAASLDATIQYYEVQHKLSTDSNYLSALQSAATQTAYLAPVQSGLTYHVRVRAVRVNGAVSAWAGPVSIAASATASTISAGLPYSAITGTKPPADADKTETSLQGGTVIATGGLTLYDTSEIVTHGAGGNYSRLHSGDLEIYRNVPSVGLTLYKALSRVESGTASNNTLITIPGYFALQPRVQVSPATLSVFDKDYAAQDQALICTPGSVTETVSGSMIWQFTPTATLSLASGNGQTLTAETSGAISADNWTSTTHTTPANTTSITPSLTLASARGDGASLYYYRTVRWRVEYFSGGSWVNGAWTTTNLSASAGASVTTSATHTFPSSATWQFRIRTEAYDTNGTKFGSVQYEYNSSDTGSRSDWQNMLVAATRSYTQTNIAPAYTPPSGWTLDSVNFSFTYEYLVQDSSSGYLSDMYVGAELYPRYYPVVFGGGIEHAMPSRLGSAISGSNLSQSGFITSANNLTLTAVSLSNAQCSIRGLTVNATYTRKRVIANSTTPSNTSTFNNYQYALTAAQVLATGTLNWIALGQ